jgi:exodeoxyribonuclease V beta subunit
MPDLTGLLNGIIDLVFEYDGKYYIVDWKTNFLGSRFSDYREENLRDAMMRSGYVLQYHLYTAALCMRMKQGMNGFDYDAFGGVYYLFPRGMGKGEDGIWFDRPPMECINGLVKLFSGEEL